MCTQHTAGTKTGKDLAIWRYTYGNGRPNNRIWRVHEYDTRRRGRMRSQDGQTDRCWKDIAQGWRYYFDPKCFSSSSSGCLIFILWVDGCVRSGRCMQRSCSMSSRLGRGEWSWKCYKWFTGELNHFLEENYAFFLQGVFATFVNNITARDNNVVMKIYNVVYNFIENAIVLTMKHISSDSLTSPQHLTAV